MNSQPTSSDTSMISLAFNKVKDYGRPMAPRSRKPSVKDLAALVAGSPELQTALTGLVGRLRQCPLEGCGKWFLPRKRQRFCSREHANKFNYLLWAKRGRPRGTRGREQAFWKKIGKRKEAR